jgi:hypothetical protein
MAFFRRRVVAKLVGCCAAVASPKGGLAPTAQAARHSGCTEPPGWPGAPSLPVPLLVAPTRSSFVRHCAHADTAFSPARGKSVMLALHWTERSMVVMSALSSLGLSSRRLDGEPAVLGFGGLYPGFLVRPRTAPIGDCCWYLCKSPSISISTCAGSWAHKRFRSRQGPATRPPPPPFCLQWSDSPQRRRRRRYSPRLYSRQPCSLVSRGTRSCQNADQGISGPMAADMRMRRGGGGGMPEPDGSTGYDHAPSQPACLHACRDPLLALRSCAAQLKTAPQYVCAGRTMLAGAPYWASAAMCLSSSTSR